MLCSAINLQFSVTANVNYNNYICSVKMIYDWNSCVNGNVWFKCTRMFSRINYMQTGSRSWQIPCSGEITWWRHQMETFSALLVICARNSPVAGEFPAQRPVMRTFDVFFDLHPNKRLSKQWWGWWFETPSCPSWCHRNELSSIWIIVLTSMDISPYHHLVFGLHH